MTHLVRPHDGDEALPTRLLVGVVGASGFVGSAIASALESLDIDVRGIRAPRLPGLSLAAVPGAIADSQALVKEAARHLIGCHAVVNAAGIAEATSGDEQQLAAANAMLPGVLAAASRQAGVSRFVHVSSAAVQGDIAVLDASFAGNPTSPYARAKWLGEKMVLEHGGRGAVVYRPAGVHGANRAVTRRLATYARSPLAVVAAGVHPTPQALVADVASAVAFVATTSNGVPAVVAHPWAGLTTVSLLEALGGRKPHTVPRPVGRLLVALAGLRPPRESSGSATRRRVELLLFGQRQAQSWLIEAGWQPVTHPGDWLRLARQVAAS